MTKLRQLLSNHRALALAFLVVALAASVQSLVLGTKTYVEGGRAYNKYNNYTIFERSFYHLREGRDLYVLYPEEHWDLYKYTPSFSALFGIFAVFPDWIGLPLWNITNAFLLLIGIYYLPQLTDKQQGIILLICLVELLGNMQNEQSNGLMAGLIILAFGLLERGRYGLAALCLVSTVYVKLFGIVGFALFLFYPRKGKLILSTLIWSAVLFVIPLLFTSYEQYLSQLSVWGDLLLNDHSASYGFSVMGWLYAWLGTEVNKSLVVLVGVVGFLLPLVRVKQHSNYTFRLLTLTSVLLWVVIFNHKAESPTFIIAMSGVVLWFMTSEKSTINVILFVSALVFTTLSPTDLFPRFLRKELVEPYMLKAFPCILIWVKIIYDMLTVDRDLITEDYDTQQNVALPEA